MLLLLYREWHGFESAFFTLRRFLPSTPFPYLVHAPEQPSFIRVFLGTGCSNSMAEGPQGPHAMVRKTVLTQLFV